MNPRKAGMAALFACVIAASPSWGQQSQHATPEIKRAQLTINHRAEADGFVRVRVQAPGGDPTEVTVDVLRRMGENEVAEALARALTVALGSSYDVRRAGENVHVHRGDGAGFHVEVTFNTPGLWVLLDD